MTDQLQPTWDDETPPMWPPMTWHYQFTCEVRKMPGKIKPALTADEWRDRVGIINWPTTGEREEGCAFIDFDGDLCITYDTAVCAQGVRSEEVKVVLALANHALFDGHPIKITRDDVRLLRAIADDYEFRGTSDNEDLNKLAAKLAALLPP